MCWGCDLHHESDELRYYDINKYFIHVANGVSHICTIVDKKSRMYSNSNSNSPSNETHTESADSEILCWGDNSHGQTDISLRVKESDVWFISTGVHHSCAVSADKFHDYIDCWGNNRFYTLDVPLQLSYSNLAVTDKRDK